jgi:hypothetical protein
MTADAPLYLVLIVAMGLTILGISVTGSLKKATMPKSVNKILNTIAITGRSTLVSEINIIGQPHD